MAGTTQGQTAPLTERSDIHKCCKSLENIVNVFGEYCHTLNAVVSQQKKLSKALKEASTLKCLNEITVNAMTCSAGIFETLADVDGKFTKFADKECENISAELRKWFKKLAKEEKLHDERITSMNTKIKQAGQAYEKKAKKNGRDAVEEHARYVALLNSMGPEMSQDKYNHTLFVSQKQQLAVYSVAACLSRMADAEWLRTCEGVRRFGPSIGQLGEWRTLCEANWSGAVPQDLPGDTLSISEPPRSGAVTPRDDDEKRARQESLDRVAQEMAAMHTGKSSASIASATPKSPSLQSNMTLPTLGSLGDSGPATPSIAEEVAPQPTGDTIPPIASLAFPQPPTHFPIPNLRTSSNSSESSTKPGTTAATSPESQQLNTLREDPEATPLAKSLVEGNSTQPQTAAEVDSTPRAVKNTRGEASGDRSSSPRIASPSPRSSPRASPHVPPQAFNPKLASSSDSDRARTSPVQTSSPPSPTKMYNRSRDVGQEQGDYDDREFGVERRPYGPSSYARTYDSSSRASDGIDSSSARPSIVASMKDRYSSGLSGSPTSPKRRDLPRLPKNVAALANRYEPMDPQAAAAAIRAASPPVGDRYAYSQLTPQNTADTVSSLVDRYRMPDAQIASPVASRSTSANNAQPPTLSTPPPQTQSQQDLDEMTRRRRRIDELKELEMKEQELELRERELEIERRAQLLERERAKILNARTNMGSGGSETNFAGVGSSAVPVPRPRTMSVTAVPQQRSAGTGTSPRPESQYSQYSAYGQQQQQQQTSESYPFPYTANDRAGAQTQTHQAVPPSEQRRMRRSSQGNPGTEHAPFCGCQACSVERYKATAIANGREAAAAIAQANSNASSTDLRAPEKPFALRGEKGGESKPKSWMRRLSMPVVAPFSSDGKRGSGEPRQVGAGIMGGSRNSLALPEEDPRTGGGGAGRKSWERDPSGGVSNRSVASFASGR